jgi:hypothetical protein
MPINGGILGVAPLGGWKYYIVAAINGGLDLQIRWPVDSII